MANTLRETNNTNFFRCYTDGKLNDQCKILIDLENAGRVETVIEKVEKKEFMDEVASVLSRLPEPFAALPGRLETHLFCG